MPVSTPPAAREKWSSKLGFTLAAIGSAVGLGNMWRFPYKTADAGGAAFVVLYLGMTALVGIPLMLAEMTVGRGSGKSPIEALTHFGGKAWGRVGYVYILAGTIILGFYSVVAGWTARYAIEIAVSGLPADPAGHFEAIAFGDMALVWHLGFMLLTTVVVSGGIRGGIEKASLVLMPVLAALVLGLAAYAATLEGSEAGYAYYLGVDFSKVLSLEVLVEAAGQAFFSLSLGMGAILTYSSYLSDDHHLPNESLIISIADFGVAFFAGLVVFPLLFAFGLQAQAQEGLGTLFVALPVAFEEMGGFGRVLGAGFFLALAVGALTSTISLLEVVVSSAVDNLGWNRPRAAWTAALVIFLIGAPAAFSGAYLGLMDAFAGEFLLVIGGLMLSLFVGWAMDDPIGEVSKGTSGIKWFFAWRFLLRFVVPAVLVLVLVFSVQKLAAQIAGFFG